MIVMFRRRYLAAAALVLLLAATVFAAIPHKRNTISVLSPQRIDRTVIIDAGHGGTDGGAVSQSGVIESHLNLQIAKKVREIFAFLGQPTVMTRTGEDGLYNTNSHTIRQKKVADTRNRVELINRYESAVLISIHQNSMPNAPKVHGAQVFFNTKEQARMLANSIQAALNGCINEGNEKTETAIPKSVYIMSHVNCDAILVECGFLSNGSETELLQQDDYQRKLAAAIVCGYLNE